MAQLLTEWIDSALSVLRLHSFLDVASSSPITVVASWTVSFLLSFKVVCVLSSEKKDLYDSIKQYLCVSCPIPSQCVITRTLDKPRRWWPLRQRLPSSWTARWEEPSGRWRQEYVGVCCLSLPSLYFSCVRWNALRLYLPILKMWLLNFAPIVF